MIQVGAVAHFTKSQGRIAILSVQSTPERRTFTDEWESIIVDKQFITERFGKFRLNGPTSYQ